MRIHDLNPQELAALTQAYRHNRGEIGALAKQRGRPVADPTAWAVLEVLARRNLLRFYSTKQLADGTVVHTYRITQDGRRELDKTWAAPGVS